MDAGRIDLATKMKVRSAGRRIGNCTVPSDFEQVENPLNQILIDAGGARVLAFNESHTSLEQRLFLYQNLDEFWEAGYRHIGYEALSWDFDFNLPLDKNKKAQGYISEPLMAGSIRKAQRLGFKLFAYESNSKAPETDDWKVKTDFRETEQAQNVAAYIETIPNEEKIILWAGWQHISKKWDAKDFFAEAWMAARLETTHGVPVYSVDLTGCNYASSSPSADILGFKQGSSWKVEHDRYDVDAQLRLPAVEADLIHTGQYRQALGQETYLSQAARQQSDLMLVQAFKLEQAESSVPYDSVFMFEGENLPLYLPKGRFNIFIYAEDGTKLDVENIEVK
ncbi:hypothetical protein KFE96_14000 [Kordiimonas sp. SCSIO 12603]|uniref:hypothetical protein n=1 Tax=Kordiimonas sp. SCSIO 12603 TaxID=2829596 RepID=UPI002106F68D|nr:hypothetical protein [Kordiimonas sp. SCSIO 12603]UTW57929.1 hypothetical protein KFE96_14000 [Kordiimonas sp. SCSIO 12603]